jgi:serine/threonine protein kinase
MKLSFEKIDVWSFGFLAHKLVTRDLPAFDANRKPVLAGILSQGMLALIARCLSVQPALRPSWQEIDLKDIARSIVV